ncbi:unnamed protein product [Bursaphelenchus xylophilus]|uniref:(pine wood nematode) hypothetical protein n=1 Tax=Bursaphelenchus xylophilus TaxID=6326 RepID=A0A1I7SVC7_BURXY|nr:unnamed protein product [Bursaphelenchus xylophilus]CAG9101239.1 unnamed protein product [Bursaphelenchus xylophilus]
MTDLAESLLQDLAIHDKKPHVSVDSASEASHSGSGSRPSSSQKAHSIGSSSTATQANVTKVYYHVDDEPIAYMTEVRVPSDRITLGDFKRVLNRSNFKYYCKAVDPAVGAEVKCEIRDDDHVLQRSSNGHFELFLLTTEGSTHSDGGSTTFSKPYRHGVPGPAPNYPSSSSHLYRPKNYYEFGSYRRPFEESTVYTESEARVYSDDESHVSTSTDNVTSVSRQPHNYYRRRQHRRFRRQPSRASTMSSMTETSMSLQVMHVRLNMDTVKFLGITVVGQSSARGDNGIYVAHVMPGGAVALDGRIEIGDMILEVNDVSLEKMTNDEAVEFLREAVTTKGPIKLTVAKCVDSNRANFLVSSREPVRPIDTRAWVQHTNAMIGMPMNSIPESAEEAPTPIPGQYPQNNSHPVFCRPQSSSTATSNGSGGPKNTVVGIPGAYFALPPRLDLSTDKKIVAKAMAMPNSGLEVRNRTWLKIPVPMSFLGSALLDWIHEHVEGIRDRKEARKYASELLKDRLIAHVVNKSSFTEQCYYVFGEDCQEILKLRNEDGTPRTDLMPQPPMHPPKPIPGHSAFGWTQARSTGDYASMPVSPYPGNGPFIPTNSLNQPLNKHGDIHSQASGNSNDGSSSSDQRRKPLLPAAPPLPMGLNPLYQQGPQPPPSQPPPLPPFEARDPSSLKLDDLGSNQQLQALVSQGFTVDHL